MWKQFSKTAYSGLRFQDIGARHVLAKSFPARQIRSDDDDVLKSEKVADALRKWTQAQGPILGSVGCRA